MIDELLFLTWSRVIGKPWAPDPWLRAKQRQAFSLSMAEGKAAELYARLAILDGLRAELLECVDELDAWTERGAWYALEAERIAAESPWVGKVDAGGEETEPKPSRNWNWSDARDRYVHAQVELEEEEITDAE